MVCDVTIPVIYQLEPRAVDERPAGLHLSGSKMQIVGFSNPIAPQLAYEHAHPVLCLISMKTVMSLEADDDTSVSEVTVQYYSERQSVTILI